MRQLEYNFLDRSAAWKKGAMLRLFHWTISLSCGGQSSSERYIYQVLDQSTDFHLRQSLQVYIHILPEMMAKWFSAVIFLALQSVQWSQASEAEELIHIDGCDHEGAMEGVMEPTRADQLGISAASSSGGFPSRMGSSADDRTALDRNKDADVGLHRQDTLAVTPHSVQHRQDDHPGESRPRSDEIEVVEDALPAPHDRSDERRHKSWHIEKEYYSDDDEAFARAIARQEHLDDDEAFARAIARQEHSDDDEAFARAIARQEQGDSYSRIQAGIQSQYRPRIRPRLFGNYYLPFHIPQLSLFEWSGAFVLFIWVLAHALIFLW